MASLELNPASGRYRVRFRFEGRAYKRSLRTQHRRVAESSIGQVEETLRMLTLALTGVPAGVDEGAFVVSGVWVVLERCSARRLESAA